MPVKGIRFPHEVPAQWDAPCVSAQPAVATASAWRRVLLTLSRILVIAAWFLGLAATVFMTAAACA